MSSESNKEVDGKTVTKNTAHEDRELNLVSDMLGCVSLVGKI